MNPKERFLRFMDSPMTWTRAILYGMFIWIFSIAFMGQLPSYIIYWFDGEVAAIIDFTTKLPLINKEGLNPTQIAIVRDLIANAVQTGFLVGMLVFAYFWQKAKIKRTGAKGLEDPVKGYMPGK